MWEDLFRISGLGSLQCGVSFKSLRLFILMSRMVGSRILRNKIGTLTHLSAHHHHVHYTTSGGPPKSGGPLASPAVSSSSGVPLSLASPPTVTSLPYNHLYQSHFPPYSPPLSSPTKSGVFSVNCKVDYLGLFFFLVNSKHFDKNNYGIASKIKFILT